MKLIYSSGDRVTIFQAAPFDTLRKVLPADEEGQPASDEACAAHVLDRLGLKPGDFILVADDWTPAADRRYRDAWRLRGGRLVVDMDAARELHLARLRADRRQRLAELDIAELKALGQSMRDIEDGKRSFVSAEAGQIAAMKQALRDAPASPRIAEAGTPDDLAALTLDALVA